MANRQGRRWNPQFHVNVSKILPLLDRAAFSERTRKIVWMGTLILIFVMERRRTWMRATRNLAVTRVVSGVILESPDDIFPNTGKFVNISTGSEPYWDIPTCVVEPSCQVHYPFVDLRDYNHERGKQQERKRLKQIMRLPEGQGKFAILTQRGIGMNHEDGNQDRSLLIYPFHPFPSKPSSNDFLLCMLDGHGPDGQTVVQAVMHDIPQALTVELRKAQNAVSDATQLHQLMTQILINTFHKVDQHVPDDADVMSGTTLSIALKLGDHLHIANVGDSQTFVVIYHPDETVEILYATRPDKPDVEDERQRVLRMGGSLWLPPPTTRGVQPPPRVYLERIIDPNTNETENFVLGISRSIGDRVAHEFGVVLPDPIVASLQISAFTESGKQLFCFSATKGLLEKMAAVKIAERLAPSLYRPDTVSPLEIIEGIILDANENWSRTRRVQNNELEHYRDDMSLSVVKVLT